MDYLGAHMSIAGGVSNAIDRGVKLGCGTIQIFTQNTNRWQGKPVSEPEGALFRGKWKESGLHDIVVHDIYLINLAAPEGELRDKSLVGFAEEMARCARLGIGKIIMHPGSHVGDGEVEGIERIAAAFDSLFESVPEYDGKVLLETTAGQGTSIGYRFEHLRDIMGSSSYPDRFAVCFDTCHTFAAGYNIVTEQGYHDVFQEFDDIIGLDRLLAFHLNDSKKGLNCRVDRHEHIGQGAMGLAPFRLLLNDDRFTAVPKVLETPKDSDDALDAMNLKVLRDLVVQPQFSRSDEEELP